MDALPETLRALDDASNSRDVVSGLTTDEKLTIYRERQLVDALRDGRMRTIDDIWEFFGAHNIYYVRFILLNSIAFFGSTMFVALSFYSTLDGDEFVHDCNHNIVFASVAHASHGRLQLQDIEVDAESFDVIQFFGQFFGLIILYKMRHMEKRVIVLVTCLAVAIPAFLEPLMPIIFFSRLSLFVASIGTKITLSLIFISSSEGVPAYLRPLSIYSCFCFGSFAYALVPLLTRSLSTAKQLWFIVVGSSVTSAFIYVYFIPDDLMAGIIRKDVNRIKAAILPFAKRRRDEHIDFEGIIDDVVCAGEVATTERHEILTLLTRKSFAVKLIMIIVVTILGKGVNDVRWFRKFVPYEVYEHRLTENYIYSLTFMFFLIFVCFVGRRPALTTALAVLFASQLGLAAADNYTYQWTAWNLTFFCYLGSAFGLGGVDYITTLMLLEHIPHRLRSKVYPLVQMCIGIGQYLMLKPILKDSFGSDDETRMFYLFPFAFMTLLALVVSLFLDNSDYSAISINEIRAYGVKHKVGDTMKEHWKDQMSKRPEIFVTIHIKNIQLKALLDLDSNSSKISASLVRSLKLRLDSDMTESATSPDGNSQPVSSPTQMAREARLIIGTVNNVTFDFGQFEFTTSMLVKLEMKTDVILGRAFLEDHGAHIDYAHTTLTLDEVATGRFLPISWIPLRMATDDLQL